MNYNENIKLMWKYRNRNLLWLGIILEIKVNVRIYFGICLDFILVKEMRWLNYGYVDIV